MRNFIGLTFLLALGLLVSSCAKQDVFQSSHCASPVNAPIIDNATLTQFIKLHLKLLPEGNALVIVVPTDYFFRLNSPQLKPDTHPELDQLAKLLKAYGPAKIKIAGYTDNVGAPTQNLQISSQQARALLTYLWVDGIPADQLYAVGYGDRMPVADNTSPQGSSANRRIEITVKASCV